MDVKQRKYLDIKLYAIFLIIQPIIDILTALFLVHFNLEFTPGIIIRNLALIFFFIYIFVTDNNKRWILLLLIIFYGIHFIINVHYKPVFNMYQEISYYTKFLYFICCLLFLCRIILTWDYSDRVYLIEVLNISMIIISVCIILAGITNTGIQSYGSEKIGQIGWFYSGTKISAAMAGLFPISIITAINKKSKGVYIYWIFIVIEMIAMFMTGTKTSYVGMLIGLVGALIILILQYLKNKEKLLIQSVIIIVTLLTCFTIYSFYSPTLKNIQIHESWDEEVRPDIIFNGREIKLSDAYDDYSNTGYLRKMFGTGYGGDYRDINEVVPIERDFHEIFIYYGAVGFVLFLMYPFTRIMDIISYRVRNWNNIDYKMDLLIISLFSSLGCGFIAGHVLFAPSVSIYLATVIALLTPEGGKRSEDTSVF